MSILYKNGNKCNCIVLYTIGVDLGTSSLSPEIYIREYGSTLYVGMARKRNGRTYISIASGKLKSLVIYTYKLKYTYNL